MSSTTIAMRRPRKRSQAAVPEVARHEAIDLRCDVCGADAVVVEPGSEDVHELFLLARGAPMRRWCFEHWRAALRDYVGQP
jgi:hypothetical protein